MRSSWTCSLAAAALMVSTCGAHMDMASPPPRRSKFNPFALESQIDYSMTAPLLADGSNYPCKRYPAGKVVKVVKAGSTLPVKMDGTVFHMGGHCQWSISYDGGKSFLALKTVLDKCFTGTGLNIKVPFPKELPPCGHCIFAWSWINAVGNREFYMNCADIAVSSSSRRPYTGPAMVVANLPGHPTVPEFRPDRGESAGKALYSKAGRVTVRPQSGAPPKAPPRPRKPSPPPKPITPPTSGGGGGGGRQCTLGFMRCAGSSAFQQCAPAAGGGSYWSVASPCARETKCSQDGNYIKCA